MFFRQDIFILWDKDCVLFLVAGSLHLGPHCARPGGAPLLDLLQRQGRVPGRRGIRHFQLLQRDLGHNIPGILEEEVCRAVTYLGHGGHQERTAGGAQGPVPGLRKQSQDLQNQYLGLGLL